MRVLMFSWEYPPVSVGGLAQHVKDLTKAMAKQEVEIHLITCGGGGAPAFEVVDGVNIHRVNSYTNLSTPDFRTGILHLNFSMLEYVMNLLRTFEEAEPVQLIHIHDWLVAYVGRVLKHSLNVPMIATIHATEWGRNYGLHNDEQRYISDVEWWLTYEAWKVIVCSNYMDNELKRIFQLPDDKIRIIPNGVEPENFIVNSKNDNFKSHYALPQEKIIFFVGRLVQEKGVQVLLDAIPKILHYQPNTRFLIAGKGPHSQFLQDKARNMGIGNKVSFLGYIDDDLRNRIYQVADIAVFPSLYEPFGIVALEAMAAKTAVVVSDTGGLGEIIKHQVNGMKAYTGSADSLADNILYLLGNPKEAMQIRERAYKEVLETYSWQQIAKETISVYNEVRAEYSESNWNVGNWGHLMDYINSKHSAYEGTM